MKNISSLLLLCASLFVLCAFTGCVATHVKKGDLEFKRTSVLNKTGIGKVHVNPVTGEVTIEGYTNEQTEIAAAVAGSVAAALSPVK